jgi:hypothetical protein
MNTDPQHRGRMAWQRLHRHGLVTGEQRFHPRTKSPRRVPRYAVPAGTRVSIRRVVEDDNHWRDYVTVAPIAAERYERYVRDPDAGLFYQFALAAG